MKILERTFKESGKDYALRVIRDNIISLELEPGSTVSANEIGIELGVSRGPVREALNELSKINIVEVYPQSGCKIASINLDMLEEAKFLRSTLECAAVKEACQNATKEDILKLSENVMLQEMYLKNNLKEKLYELDNEFHKLIFEIAHKKNIYDLMKNYIIHLDRFRTLSLLSVKEIKIVEDHQKILAALESKSGDEAAALMQMHLDRDKINYDEIRAQYPGYFVDSTPN